jgi:t-SNARE complex subunit (syntaxin)
MDVFIIHAVAFFAVLVALAFIAGGMSRLKNHNIIQDEAIANIKTAYSNDITTIKKDLVSVEEDVKAISEGQARMYSDFKATLNEALKPLVDSNNRQSERLERQAERLDNILQMLAQKGGKM